MRQIHILIAMTYVFVLVVGSKKLLNRKVLMSNLSLYYAIALSVCLSVCCFLLRRLCTNYTRQRLLCSYYIVIDYHCYANGFCGLRIINSPTDLANS